MYNVDLFVSTLIMKVSGEDFPRGGKPKSFAPSVLLYVHSANIYVLFCIKYIWTE